MGRGFPGASVAAPGVRPRDLQQGRGHAARSSLSPGRFAEEACALLTSPTFEACHGAVGPGPYLRNCRYDVCSCSNGRDCLCSAVANYAAACARKGVHIGWREPGFCGECPLPPGLQLSTQPRLVPAAAPRALRSPPFQSPVYIVVFINGPGSFDKHELREHFICSHFLLSSTSRTRWRGLALP